MPMSGTRNTTSFARDTLDATALILDALAEVGETRRAKLTEAQRLLYDAVASSYDKSELAVPAALVEVIKDYERAGLDR